MPPASDAGASQCQGEASLPKPQTLRTLRTLQASVLATGYFVWTVQPDGRLGDVTMWRAFTGESLQAMAQHSWLNAIHPDERARASQIWTDAVASTRPFVLECRVRRADHRYRDVLVRGVPLCSADGAVREWVLTGTDVTEQAAEGKAHDTAPIHARQLEAILEAMVDGVVAFDHHGSILMMNAAARRFLPIERLANLADLAPAEPLMSLRDRILAGEVLTGEERVDLPTRTRDGWDVTLSLSGAPVRAGDGQIIGGVVVLRDVTNRRWVSQHTREALDALVAMAEDLVATGAAASEAAQETRPSDDRFPQWSGASAVAVAQRLADMTRLVTGVQRVGIVALDPREEDQLRLVAASGLTEQEVEILLPDRLPHALVDQLARGESIVIDFAQPQFAEMRNPFGVRSASFTPMRLGGRLIGFLVLDHERGADTIAPDELALTEGTARLAALVLERERLSRERGEARSRELAARQVQQHMDQFFAMAAHDIRSPVSAIRGYAQLALRRYERLENAVAASASASGGDSGTRDLADPLAAVHDSLLAVDQSGERLAQLVARLFDVAQARTGILNVTLAPCDLAALLREHVAAQRAATPARILQLDLMDGNAVPMLADADRLNQVLANYLTNALKYSAEDRPVVVRLEVLGQQARVEVRDQGPGLSAEEQERVWEIFYRAPGIEGQSGASGSLGLGLYICKIIIERHGGTVGVTSAVGQGSTFWFTLPLAQTDTHATSPETP